jgi:hypothetical protein
MGYSTQVSDYIPCQSSRMLLSGLVECDNVSLMPCHLTFTPGKMSRSVRHLMVEATLADDRKRDRQRCLIIINLDGQQRRPPVRGAGYEPRVPCYMRTESLLRQTKKLIRHRRRCRGHWV